MKKVKLICDDCSSSLSVDEVALCRKLFGVNTARYLCILCMAEFIGCSEEDLKIKIEEYKEQGCTLFI